MFLLIPDLVIAAAFERGAFGATRRGRRRACSPPIRWDAGLFVDRIVSASFLSRGDTATPLKVTLVGVALNVALKIALFGRSGRRDWRSPPPRAYG